MPENIKHLFEGSEKLDKEIIELRQKLRDAKEALDAIKAGNIDALVVADKEELKVYTEKTSDKTYRILIEKMHEGAVTLNEDGTILYCNFSFANMVRLPLQKVPGIPFSSFIEDSSKDRLEALLKKGMRSAVKEEISIYTNEAESVPVLMSLNPFSSDSTTLLSIILTDLTIQNKNHKELSEANARLHQKAQLLQQQEEELKTVNDELLRLNQNLEKRVFERTAELEKLNQELIDLNLSKDKFLSVISHDLRNPLTALLVSSDVLGRKTENDVFQEIKPLIKIIDRTIRTILQQLNELLNWAQTQRDQTRLNPEKIYLFGKVEHSLVLLKDIAAQKNVVLENKVAAGIYVNADSIMLRSIIQNLVTNAIKYTPQNGLITIVAQRVDNMVEIGITDSGIGMEADLIKSLFTNFNSAPMSGRDIEKGTGLGLILVKDFVSQLGGNIHVESELGKGTSVIFTVPKY